MYWFQEATPIVNGTMEPWELLSGSLEIKGSSVLQLGTQLLPLQPCPNSTIICEKLEKSQ